MKDRRVGPMSALRPIALYCIAGLTAVVCTGVNSSQPQIGVSVTLPRTEYLLCEPMLLGVKVTNLTTEAIKAQTLCLTDCEPEVEVHISQDGKVFHRYEMGIYDWADLKRNVETLKPGESWNYALKVLYTYKVPSGLAFEKPGSYFLKVVYPLLWVESEERRVQRIEFTSNTVQIRIRPPVGKDAQVWEQIKGPDFAYFLQSGDVKLNREDWEEAKKTVTPTDYANGSWLIRIKYGKFIPTALSIFESYAKTTYREPLREALLSFYNGCKYAVSEEQANRMRTVLRIKEGLFPDDTRLNTMLEIAFPEMTPLDEVFAYVSKQTGVPLYLDDQFKKGRLKSFPRDKLRRFMSWMSAYKAEWIPVGKGYRLVPKAEESR